MRCSNAQDCIGLFNSVVNLILLVAVNTVSKRINEVSLW